MNNQDLNYKNEIINEMYSKIGNIIYDLKSEGITAEYLHDNQNPNKVVSIISYPL